MLPPATLDVPSPADAPAAAPAPNERAAAPQLARDLGSFLIELAIAMHKHAIYPAGHPLLVQTVDAVYRTLLDLLVDRAVLSIGVARRQLIIEGVATESTHPLLSELAGKLHRHHLGAVKFARGVTRDEIADALTTVGLEPARDAVPLGLQPALLEHRWAHVRLFALTYDRLELVEDDAGEPTSGAMQQGRAAQLWVGLARAALAGDRPPDDRDAPDALEPAAVAQAIDAHGREEAYDQVIVGYMLQIADETRRTGHAEGAGLKRRISRLVGALQPETLRRLLEMGGDVDQRRRFVLDAAQAMNVDAVVELVQAAAAAEGQTISHSLVRMLTKLAAHADGETLRGHAADGALREHVVRLVSDWSLDDPNPLAYSRALERMSRDGETVDAPGADDDALGGFPCEPARLLEIAFELDAAGATVTRAAEALLADGSLGTLLDLLDGGAAAPAVSAEVWRLIDGADALAALLAAPRLDAALVERLVRSRGLAALPSLVRALEGTTLPARREQLVERIVALGPDAAPAVAARLADAAPALARELLSALALLAPPAPPREARAFLTHADPALRREAVRLLAPYPDTREVALTIALRDADARVVAAGLRAAQDGCPSRVAALVRQRLERGEIADDDVRAAAVRAVAAAVPAGRFDRATVDWLVARVVRPARLFRPAGLLAPSAELCAALAVLHARWPADPRVAPVLGLALGSPNSAVRKAAGGAGSGLTGVHQAIPDPAARRA